MVLEMREVAHLGHEHMIMSTCAISKEGAVEIKPAP